ncbi:MAG: hypothetical protein JSW61_03375 [Candidatus Thorarchaeota archaeon]|nr:MAG: hypothetical protein JSW61_03375 [Candidatus Thorarchaeota archaeon]
MSLQDKFEEEMRKICEEFYKLDKERDAIEEQLEHLHEYMEITLRKYEKDEYDDPDVPVKVKRMVHTSERMKKGGKEKLREMLTPDQWSEIYEEPEETERIRVTPRRDWKG